MLRVFTFFTFIMMTTCAYAFDWKQLILDENNHTVIDWPSCPPTRQITANNPWGSDSKDKCDVELTIGILSARVLLAPEPQNSGGTPQKSGEQKALEGHLGLEIILHPDMTPTPDQLKMVHDALGKLPSPLAVARAWDILDKAVK